jgi:hypothetical protein
MKRSMILLAAVALLVVLAWADQVSAGCCICRRGQKNATAYWHAQSNPWHGAYYDAAWGMPVALVVPPTAETQTHWSWGVGSLRVTPIEHQYHYGYPEPGTYDRSWFQPTPRWPSSTDQFGDYYIRGPW